VLWITGKAAIEVTSLEKEDIERDVRNLLEAFEYADEIPEIATTRTTNWYRNPLTRGSYSFCPVGATSDDFDRLAEPVGETKPRVLFAGEATDRTQYSTVNGAHRSGIRAAETLIREYS